MRVSESLKTCDVAIFFRYDHLNYVRWGSVYIAEMEQLPKEVSKKGNFVVKWNESRSTRSVPITALNG